MRFTILKRALAGALILLSVASPAPAVETHRITWDMGGGIEKFYKKYTEWRLAGDDVIIDGLCVSACTMVTGLMPQEKVCVTPQARLAFHSAHYTKEDDTETFAKEGTRMVWYIYPQPVRDILMRHGWNEGIEHPDLIYIEGVELLSIFNLCEAQG